MKKIFFILIILFVLIINQFYYLFNLQFQCTQKIEANKELNWYEIASIYQTHTNLWLFGWIVSPNTAEACFDKQFNIRNPIITLPIKTDEVVEKAKLNLLNNKYNKIKLTWKNYNSGASIYLNGSYISIDSTNHTFLYEIPLDYKPGVINILGIKLSETNFDYLENQNIIKSFTIYKHEKL